MIMMNQLSKENFNLTVLNLFIGLQKGNRLLKPYSFEFKKLGYLIFAIEKKFNNSAQSTITPDLILNSNVLENQWPPNSPGRHTGLVSIPLPGGNSPGTAWRRPHPGANHPNDTCPSKTKRCQSGN